MAFFEGIDPAFARFVIGNAPLKRLATGFDLAPDGSLLGKILAPELVSNLCFGGRANHRLFITATSPVYAVTLNRRGAQEP